MLTRCRIGTRIDRHRLVDSTNRVAFDAAADGAPDGTVIVADAQLAGRGRLSRRWHSPAGRNLYLSILLRPPLPQTVTAALPFLAAVAALDAIRAATGLSVMTKWPNDLTINGLKVGGVLVETRRAGAQTRLAVVGIGINVNWPRRLMPPSLRPTATSVQTELGRSASRPRLLAALLDRFDRGYRRLSRNGSAPLMKRWSRSCLTLQQLVRVRTPAGALTGRAAAIDGAGRLTLHHADGSTSRLTVDGTMQLRPAEPAVGVVHALRD
jgi:BirA family biotin operon repressor/biotin-[acetyl-CoA-carboxylase] ligase